MTRVINKFIEQNDYAKRAKVDITGDDMREGLACVLSVKMPDPKFSSQTKMKLVSSEERPAEEEVVAEKHLDRTSVVEGKRVEVRVDLGGRRNNNKKKTAEMLKRVYRSNTR